MDTKTRLVYMLPTTNPLQLKDAHRLKVRARKKIFHANGNQTKAGVAMLISDKIDFKIKTVARDKGHYITINYRHHSI